MKAMVLPKPGPIDSAPLELRDLPVPEPGPGEILIKVEVCGVCRTDLHVVEGELRPHLPEIIPGHEIVGTVAACGPNAHLYSAHSCCPLWPRWTKAGRCRWPAST